MPEAQGEKVMVERERLWPQEEASCLGDRSMSYFENTLILYLEISQ